MSSRTVGSRVVIRDDTGRDVGVGKITGVSVNESTGDNQYSVLYEDTGVQVLVQEEEVKDLLIEG